MGVSGMAGDGLSGGRGGEWQGFRLSLRKFLGSQRETGLINVRKFQNWGGGPKKRDAGFLTGEKEHPVKNAQRVSFSVREWAESGRRKY
jgi:hypothetical protein